MRRGAERHTCGDDDTITRLAETFGNHDATSAVHHVVEVAGIAGDDAVQAPDDRQPAGGLDDRRQRDDRNLRPFARGAQAGRARGRIGDDCRKLQRFGDLARGKRNGVGAGRFRLGALRIDDIGIIGVLLHGARNGGHGGNRFDRVVAGGGFSRKHDGVRAFEDGGGDV